MEASGIDKPKRQKAVLLHLIGEDLYTIYKTLTVPTPRETESVYDTAKKALGDYFAPKCNVEFEIFTFRQAVQEPGEDLDSYYAQLRQLVKNCNFDNPESEIKSQIIQRGHV